MAAEVLDEVAEQTLDEQRSNNGDGYVLGGVFSLPSHSGHRFKSDQDQNGDRGLNEDPTELVRRTRPTRH